MPRAQANGIEIEYETFGESTARPLLLIMGLGGQLVAWPERFCRQLAERGFYVIRYDNRDVGLSTKFDAAGVPDMAAAFAAHARGEPIQAPYTLDDMADDAAGLLDALGIRAAHVVGWSLGGMVAQCFAIRYPERTLSLTSMMSTTGEPDLPPPSPEAMQVLMRPAAPDRESAIEQAVATAKVLAGGGFPVDEAEARRLAAESYDRSNYAAGASRQLLAVGASGGRRQALRSVKAPALVIHGDADPLVPYACGLDTHQAIPGSEMVTIAGMGHELPEGAWPVIIDAIERVASKVRVS
jgi:pimeloyl-ACP methyl ester carboxylesterase